jgi:hypothetical protein
MKIQLLKVLFVAVLMKVSSSGRRMWLRRLRMRMRMKMLVMPVVEWCVWMIVKCRRSWRCTSYTRPAVNPSP